MRADAPKGGRCGRVIVGDMPERAKKKSSEDCLNAGTKLIGNKKMQKSKPNSRRVCCSSAGPVEVHMEFHEDSTGILNFVADEKKNPFF